MTGQSPLGSNPVPWEIALDQIETNLAAVERALENGGEMAVARIAAGDTPDAPDAPDAPFDPAAPMPAELGARAEALLARTKSLEHRAQQELDSIRENLRALAGRRPPPPTQTGRIVDFDA